MEETEARKPVFWGLVIKPGKRYETEVQEPFRITKACIEPSTAKDGKVTSVYVECDNNEEFILANLNLKNFNESLDLSFNAGEKICFKVDGSGTVHMTGNLVEDIPESGDPFEHLNMDDSSEDDSEAMEDSEEETVEAGDKIKEVSEKEASKLKRKQDQEDQGKKKKTKVTENGDSTMDTTLGDLDDTENFAEEEDSEESEDDDSDEADTTGAAASDDDSDDDEEDSSSEEEEEEEESPKKKVESPVKKDVKTPKQAQEPKSKTPKVDAKTPSKQDDKSKTPKVDTKITNQETKTSKQESKTPKSEKNPKKESNGVDQSKTPGKTPMRFLKGGIQIEDLKVGSGPEAKNGSKVGLYYEGRLKTNNKMFDAATEKQGKPFPFKLGKGEVIKGWDIGVLGMKVGGKRRMIIPPKMAYGVNGAPPSIPPNSTLVFEVECRYVN